MGETTLDRQGDRERQFSRIVKDAVKAVMKGNLKSRTSYLNKRKTILQTKLEQQLRLLEKQQHRDRSGDLEVTLNNNPTCQLRRWKRN